MIVVGVDGSRGSAAALRWAADEARLRGGGLTAVYAYRHADVPGHEPERHAAAQRLLEHAVATMDDELADLEVCRMPQAGQPAGVLIEAAAAADLLVVGAHGAGGLAGLLLGSTAEQCALHARGTVVIVPADPTPASGRIAVGVDGSKAAQTALVWAVREATLRQAAVDVVSVYEPYHAHGPYGAEFMDIASPGWRRRFAEAAERTARDAIADLADRSGVSIEAVVDAGHPASVLTARSQTADLLAVGHRGRGGFPDLLLGSVTRQVLHHTACPVAVVRPFAGHI